MNDTAAPTTPRAWTGASPAARPKIVRANGSASARLYRQLLTDILHGHQRPGARVRLLPLASSYGTSSTTVREVLIKLVSDRLVVRHATLGFQIAPATQDDLLDLIKALGWLEEIGIRESVAGGDRHWEESVLAAQHALAQHAAPTDLYLDNDLTHWEELALAYHEALISGCRSSILLEHCRLLQQRVLRYRILAKSLPYAALPERQCAQQLRNALLSRDADAAVALLKSYYRLATAAVLASGILR